METFSRSELYKKIETYLENRSLSKRESPGLLQPLFGYPFSPSAGHHVIDEILISKQTPHSPVLKFYTVPDRSLRMYDYEKIGISSRHLSFFETIVFGFAGCVEELPKKESVDLLVYLMFDVFHLKPENIFITTFGHAHVENIKINEDEDKAFYEQWVEKLGSERVAKTNGRRNLFYSRVIGNPGGTGCEIYYKINDTYVEIGSQVNYKFKFTGGLERTCNQAILEGFGLERLLMALENKESIFETSLLRPYTEILEDHLASRGDRSTHLFKEQFNVIADHIRAISFIVYDGQEIDNTARGKILKDFIKNYHSQFVYLGIEKKDEMVLTDKLYETACTLFHDRYPALHNSKEKVIANINAIITPEIIIN